MSLEDKNIDQLFRDAAANSKAPEYNPEYWDEVSAMLDKEQPQKGIFLWWTFGGVTIAAALLMLLFATNDTDFSEERYAKSNVNAMKPVRAETNQSQQINLTTFSNQNSTANERMLTLNQNRGSGNSESPIAPVEKNSKKNNSVSLSDLGSDETDRAGLSRARTIFEPSIEAENIEITDITISKLSIKVRKIVNQINTTEKLIKKSNPFRWVAQVDLGVMENYETARPLQSGLASFVIKAEFEKSNVILRSGIGLEVATNADLIVSKRQQSYSFGLNNIQTDLSYQDMFELFIPLEFGYHHLKTRFGIGLQANYLINTTMEMNVYEGNNLISSERLTGYNNGLNLLSGQGYLWVNHQLTAKLAVGAKIGTNLTKRFNDIAYFNESAATNPIFGQLSLNYTLFE